MLRKYPDQTAAADAAAELIRAGLTKAHGDRGHAHFIATGGRAPGPVYDRLSRGGGPDWARVVVSLSDERFVPPDSPDSNERLVRERLLVDEAGKAAFVPLWSDAESPEAAARACEDQIRAMLPFDVVLLGMGEDGHIASLLPGSAVLDQGLDPAGERLCLGVEGGLGKPPLPRITLTISALLQARSILVLIAGDTKRQVVERAAAGDDYPVRAVLKQDQVPVQVLWSPEKEG